MELPSIMASLNISPPELDQHEEPEVSVSVVKAEQCETDNDDNLPKRQLRKRSSLNLLSGCVAKKSCKGRIIKNPQSEKGIQNLYLKKKCSKSHVGTKLETIFEEPKTSTDGETITMSVGRKNRALNFTVTKQKKQKRKTKVKKLSSINAEFLKKRSKCSNEQVDAKLSELRNGESSS